MFLAGINFSLHFHALRGNVKSYFQDKEFLTFLGIIFFVSTLIFVNISMVLGLLPIVGAPLPIMSYGGSSMLSIMLGLSIVMSCKIYSQDQISNY